MVKERGRQLNHGYCGYEDLANLIVFQAIEDYKRAETEHRVRSIENFIMSNWFEILTQGKLDPEVVLEEIRKRRQERVKHCKNGTMVKVDRKAMVEERRNKIIELIKKYPNITRKKLANILNVDVTTIDSDIKRLKQKYSKNFRSTNKNGMFWEEE